MEPVILKVHSVYGTIYHNGEFVQRGAVLGLSPDGKEVVTAPISGWVCMDDGRAEPASGAAEGLPICLSQSPCTPAPTKMPGLPSAH